LAALEKKITILPRKITLAIFPMPRVYGKISHKRLVLMHENKNSQDKDRKFTPTVSFPTSV